MRRILGFLLLFSSVSSADIECGQAWSECQAVPYSTTVSYLRPRLWGWASFFPEILLKEVSVRIRAGYIKEVENVPFQGNLLYFEGLADSIRNHERFFQALASAGYRVIAFDYMGQGGAHGSEGSMNDTRIVNIPEMGELVWRKFARDTELYPKKTVIGWSTGGLAAYYAASVERMDQVILIAPGIAPKVVIAITEESLTTDLYTDGNPNPHLDPINPVSPILVPDFAFDLMSTASRSKEWTIPASVRGLVLLSGEEDKYVNADTTETVVKTHSSFEVIRYPRALHEIDNEVKEIREKALQDILGFLS